MIVEKTMSYTIGNDTFSGMIAYDNAVTVERPLILIIHDWTGCNSFVKEKARLLAEQGYVGFAIDLYGNGRLGETTEEKIALMTPLKSDRKLLKNRLLATFEFAKTLPYVNTHHMAVIGFCFGGLCALDLARAGAPLSFAASFHGLLDAPDFAQKEDIEAKILVLHGYNDPMVPPKDFIKFCDEMTERKVDWQSMIYGNTMHAFMNPAAHDIAMGTVYSPQVAHEAWALFLMTLNHTFSG